MSSLLMIAAVSMPLAWEPVARLRHIAEVAVAGARPGATVTAQLDSNLHLAACADSPQATVQGNGGRPSVMLSCAGPKPWTIYVPVQVQQMAPVLVLSRPVAAGEPITADVVQLQKRDIATLAQGYLSSPSAVLGGVARRTLAAGSVLSPADVNAAPVIRRGQSVTLEYQSALLKVSAAGLALGDAAPGQSVRVENTSSHRVVNGIVSDSGRVLVGSR